MTEIVSARSALRGLRPVLRLETAVFRPSDFHGVATANSAPTDPAAHANTPTAMCFFDGQNLRRSAKHAFGIERNVRPHNLARLVCKKQGWRCAGVNYYQGSPDPNREPAESKLWNRRRANLVASGIQVFDRRVQYFEHEQRLPDGRLEMVTRVKEKGVDVRMALDVVELANKGLFDIAVLFCRDQDLSELVPTIKRISLLQDRTIELVSAFPSADGSTLRGIDGMKWVEIDKVMYESCIVQSVCART